MLPVLLFLSAVLGAGESLLRDAAFAQGLEQWRAEAGRARIEVVTLDNTPCVSIHGDTVDGYPRLVQDFDAAPGALYSASVLARADGITGGYGAYMTIEFSGADGKRIHFEQSSPASGSGAWTPLLTLSVAPPGAAKGMICLVLRGAGTALFRAPQVELTESPPSAELPSEVRLEFGAPLPGTFRGFGVEDDGWLANKDNAAKGVTEADIARVQERAAWMNPALVRMFFWYPDFNPSGDWTSFDFDSDNMRSHYRALDNWQKIGANVNLTGVEWGMKSPWAQPEAMARAIGALFSELITKREYTCIKRWTLTNEPNTHFEQEGGSFARYRELHQLVAKEFAARGLNIEIVGSDDTNGGLPWFTQCVGDPEYFGLAGSMASHFYLKKDSLRAAKYNVIDRLDLLAGRKPFTIEEFGFQDSRSTAVENPLMQEFDYALLASAFAIDAVARGVSGVTLWCLHEMHYPGTYMNYGLFHYKDKDWAPKPVFFAWSSLTRHARPGDSVQMPAAPLHPALAVVKIGANLFVVNQSAQPVRFVLEGVPLHGAAVFDEGCLPAADADEATLRAAAEGRPLAVSEAGFTVPARSFGRAW